MASERQTPTRRGVLRTIAGGVGATGLSGGVSGKPAERTVVVNVGYDAKAGRRAAKSAATRVVREFEFDALTVEVAEGAMSSIRDRREVQYVQPNERVSVVEHLDENGDGPNEGGQTLPWGVDRVDADVVHGEDLTGEGADVAVIDTGIDPAHPDLRANLGEGRAFVGCADESCAVPWDDDRGHGTHCAGIAGAASDEEGVIGVGPEVTLHAVKSFSLLGLGTASTVAAGVAWVAERGYDAASMSFGAVRESELIRDACRYAARRGVFLAGGAGNFGPCADCVNPPGAYDAVMAVTATAADDSLAGFSSTGPEVEIAAPGQDIYSTVAGGYDTLSGTSMATPHVAGAAALLMAHGDLDNAAVRRRLTSTAEDVGLAPSEAGSGLVDVAAALGYDSADDL